MLLACPAAAATQNELLVAVRALGFMTNPPKGEILVGIVYSPSDQQSAADAESVQKALAGNLHVGGLILKGKLVRFDEIRSADVGLFFLTTHLGADAAGLSAVSSSRHIVCITTDIAQVQNGTCVMGVRAEPKIEVLVNRAAAAASGISFAPIFRMMITEF